MKKIKRVLLIILYAVFSFFYARNPQFGFKGGVSVTWNNFNAETFVMMLFIGAYLTAFWIMINRLFRS